MPVTHDVAVGGMTGAERGGQEGGNVELGSGALGGIVVVVPFKSSLMKRVPTYMFSIREDQDVCRLQLDSDPQ